MVYDFGFGKKKKKGTWKSQAGGAKKGACGAEIAANVPLNTEYS